MERANLERMVPVAQRQRLLRREEYERMVEVGLFRGEHIELIRGLIVRMSPQGVSHASVIQILTRVLVPALLGRADVRVQLPFAVGDHSLPEPDLAVVAVGGFRTPHPDRASLLIEVAETSLDEDRSEKGRLYAEGGVCEYWVVNIPALAVEVYTDPSPTGYSRMTTHRARLALSAFPDVVVDLAELFAAGA
jgi:Uma2 family endonuclease